jgi:hypothetical protein
VKPGVVAVGVFALVAAIVTLREATQSRHVRMGPDTVMEVVVEASSNEPAANLTGLVSALFLVCEGEVATNPLGSPHRLGGTTFLLRMQPALDETDRRQFGGCMEDAKLDHLQAKVLSMRQVADEPRTPREP